MASFSFTGANGDRIQDLDAKWVEANGTANWCRILGNAGRIQDGSAATSYRYEDGQPQHQASQAYFPPGSFADSGSTRRILYCNGASENNSYSVRVQTTVVSVYKDAGLMAGGSLVPHGIANVATNGITARIEHNPGGVVRVLVAAGNATPATQVYSTTDAAPKTDGFPGFALNLSGETDRALITIDDWTDGISGGEPPAGPTLIIAPRTQTFVIDKTIQH